MRPAEQVIHSAADAGFDGAQFVFFVLALDLEHNLTTVVTNGRGQICELLEAQTDVLETYIAQRCFANFIIDRESIADRAIVAGQHEDEFGHSADTRLRNY